MPGPVTRTLARTIGWPLSSRTRATIVERRPAWSWRGVTVSDWHTAGGVKTFHCFSAGPELPA